MTVAIGGLLIIDGGVRRASGGLRMPVMAVAGGFAMLWAYELNVQLIGALTGAKASTLIALLPAVALLTLPIHVVAAMDIGREDRKSVVEGKSGSVRVDLGGRRLT